MDVVSPRPTRGHPARAPVRPASPGRRSAIPIDCSRSRGTCSRTPSSSRRAAARSAWSSIVNGAADRIVVTDSGKGIDPAFLPHVSRPLPPGRRLDDARSRRARDRAGDRAPARGAARRQRERRERGAGPGSRFTVLLPIHEAAPAAREDAVQAGAAREPHVPDLSATPRPRRGRRPRRPGAADGALGYSGAEVVAAESAGEALALIPDLPDVLLSDIGMSGEDGYGLIRRVRGLPPREGVDRRDCAHRAGERGGPDARDWSRLHDPHRQAGEPRRARVRRRKPRRGGAPMRRLRRACSVLRCERPPQARGTGFRATARTRYRPRAD